MSDSIVSALSPGPTEDDLLTNLIQETTYKIVGLPGNLVRPMWQRKPPLQPSAEVDWCALGITAREPFEYLYLQQTQEDTLNAQRHERLYLTAMFYGPNSDANAGKLRDGLGIPNNWWYLNRYGIRYHEVGETVLVPYNANEQFIGRTDLPFVVIRQLDRQYPIPSFLGAEGVITAVNVSTTWHV